MATAADVGPKYDVLINGQGYMLADLEEVKAQYGYTPTFVPRTNTQGDYGDNQQDFWLSATQNDWSLGQEQKYYRLADPVSRRRFWDGEGIDINIPGQVGMRADVRGPLTAAQNITAVCESNAAFTYFVLGGSSNFYQLTDTGTLSSLGAHGIGSAPRSIVLAGDSLYFCGDGTAVRELEGGVFSAFSATTVRSLAFLNNTLYGGSNAVLYRFDTAGVATALHTFQTPDGGQEFYIEKLIPYGSKLLIWRSNRNSSPSAGELWLYDGTGVTKIVEFPPNLMPSDVQVIHGIVYISGLHYLPLSKYRPSVYIYANGNLDLLWQSPEYGFGYGVSVAPWEHGVAFQHDADLLFYDIRNGGVHSLGSVNNAFGLNLATNPRSMVAWYNANTTLYQYPTATVKAQSELTTSLFDFDSSLTKIFRGITVEWDAASDGDGGSVDIEYKLNKHDSAGTPLQTGAVSGTEYTLTNVTGKSIAVVVKLNKGTSTLGPKIRRISVRAVPKQTSFRKEVFVIQCTGRDGVSPLELRDGSNEPKDGLTLAQALRTAATTTNPISITDEFGTFTGVIELEGFQIRRVRPNEFLAVVPVREV